MDADALIRWTARLAVACYVARLLVDVASPPSPQRNRRSLAIWTAGCAILWLHIAAVFHFVHGWSHAAAYEHTRRQTLAVTGWDSGAGIYVNYVFAAWWLLDVLAWWTRSNWPDRRWTYWATQVFFAFMMFNATVVFGPRGWIVVAALVVIVLAAMWLRRGRTSEAAAIPPA